MCAACTVDLSTQLYLSTSCLIFVAGANCDFVKPKNMDMKVNGRVLTNICLLAVLAFFSISAYKRTCKSSRANLLQREYMPSICNYYVH